MPAAPPPSVYDNMAAMPNVGGAPKPPATAGVAEKDKATLLAAFKAIDATFDEMAKASPAIRDDIQGMKQNLAGMMQKAGIDPKMLSGGAEAAAPPTENKSPQEAGAAPSGNKSPQEVPVPA